MCYRTVMKTHDESQMAAPAVPRVRLDDAEMRSLRSALAVVNQLRQCAEQVEAEELGFALCRAGEVLAMLTRHRGEVWLR
jgi:hypothetical protein